MLAEVGYFSLWIAFFVSIYAIVMAFIGERNHTEGLVISARNAVIVAFLLLTISTGALQIALMTEEYQIVYVWSVSSPDMSEFFRVTALWGSQAGSLLFWSFLMAMFAAISMITNWRSHRRLMGYAIISMMAVLVFFIGLSLFLENPFERWWVAPSGEAVKAVLQPAGHEFPSYQRLAETSNGLNPLLMHFGMAIHPPMLYLGFVGFIIPFAFGLAALASGDLTTNWIKASRRWTLVAWLFLSLGLVLGGRWAYDVLGWGGYWGWDPVENAAFLPWLVGTALLHSIMIQEKRGMLKVWNMFLVIATFSAVIFGTFATRSGLVDSVHSFARSGIGFPMFFFWFVLTFISVVLLIYRRHQGLLDDEHTFANIFSRETLFVINNLVFVALFVVVFWGSFGAPITSELFTGTDITLGTEYFNMVTPPLFLVLYILMGIAPLSAWGATSMARMGKALGVPVLLTFVSLGVFAVAGMNTPAALLGYGVVLLAGYVAIWETVRGVMARQRNHSENPLKSLYSLFARNQRRYGGYMIHLGVTVIGIGIIGSTLFQLETQRTLQVGQSLTIADYEMRYDSIAPRQLSEDGRIMDIARVSVFRNGEYLTTLSPRRDFFPSQGNTSTIADALSTPENDFYVLLVGWEEISQQSATFKVYINPLINLVWWGSLVLILGTALAVWPHESLVVRVQQKLPAQALAKGARA